MISDKKKRFRRSGSAAGILAICMAAALSACSGTAPSPTAAAPAEQESDTVPAESESSSETSEAAETEATTETAEAETEDALSGSVITITDWDQAAEAYSLYNAQQAQVSEETTAAEETEPYVPTTNLGKTYRETGKPAVALTFDDGPRAGSTDDILDVLEQYQAHATFFIVGENVSQNPDALKREVALGCELGTHTWNHANLTECSSGKRESQISRSVDAIEEASGGKVTCMRPPYGAIDSDVKSELELPIILWSLDTLDWKTRDAQSSLEAIQENVKGGDIILMHDIHAETAEAVKMIVPWLIENGYELLTVSELYDYYEEPLSLHKGHGSAG